MSKHGVRIETIAAYPIAREKDFLYYVDGQGYICKAPRAYVLKREAKASASQPVL